MSLPGLKGSGILHFGNHEVIVEITNRFIKHDLFLTPIWKPEVATNIRHNDQDNPRTVLTSLDFLGSKLLIVVDRQKQ